MCVSKSGGGGREREEREEEEEEEEEETEGADAALKTKAPHVNVGKKGFAQSIFAGFRFPLPRGSNSCGHLGFCLHTIRD